MKSRCTPRGGTTPGDDSACAYQASASPNTGTREPTARPAAFASSSWLTELMPAVTHSLSARLNATQTTLPHQHVWPEPRLLVSDPCGPISCCTPPGSLLTLCLYLYLDPYACVLSPRSLCCVQFLSLSGRLHFMGSFQRRWHFLLSLITYRVHV